VPLGPRHPLAEREGHEAVALSLRERMAAGGPMLRVRAKPAAAHVPGTYHATVA